MHSPALSQMPQSTGWFSRISCSVSLRRLRTDSVSVSTFMPSSIGMLQAISDHVPPLPSSTSTMHMRQLPATDRFGCQQKYGMKCPAARAACSTVWPGSACTGWPLMKKSGMGHLGSADLEHTVVLRALVLDEVFELVAELGDEADRRVARGVAHAADRRAVVGVRDRDQLVDVLHLALAVDDPIDDPVH